MEEGQLSDSDSDMTVVPSDRPLQMAVSRRARGRPGWTPGSAAGREGRGRPRDVVGRRPRGPAEPHGILERASIHPSPAAPTSPN